MELLEKSWGSKDSGVDTSKEIDGLSPDNFKDKWEEIRKHIPKTIKIKGVNNRKKYVFPTFSRDSLRHKVNGIEVD